MAFVSQTARIIEGQPGSEERPVRPRPIASQPMSTPVRRSATWLFLVAYGLFLAVAWTLSSPVGASPDEQAHIDYAWGTVTGQTIVGEHLVTIPMGGTATQIPVGGTATQIQVPNKLLQSPDPVCYRFLVGTPTVSCSPIPADTMKLVTRASYMSRYPPLFYVVEGVVLKMATALDLSGPYVLYGARLVAAMLNVLALGYGLHLLWRRFPHQVVLFATLLALPATSWFLAASVNPNGLEITAAFLLAAGVLSLRVDDALGVRLRAAVFAIPLGTLLLAWSRPLSWVWASLILAMLLLPTAQLDGESWIRRLPVRRLGAVAFAVTALGLSSAMAWVCLRASDPRLGGVGLVARSDGIYGSQSGRWDLPVAAPLRDAGLRSDRYVRLAGHPVAIGGDPLLGVRRRCSSCYLGCWAQHPRAALVRGRDPGYRIPGCPGARVHRGLGMAGPLPLATHRGGVGVRPSWPGERARTAGGIEAVLFRGCWDC